MRTATRLVVIVALFGGSSLSACKEDGDAAARRCTGPLATVEGVVASAAVLEADGGVVLAGSQRSGARGQGALMKLDPEGRVIWSRALGGLAEDSFQGVARTRDGYLALGTVRPPSEGEPDLWVVVTDREGAPRAERSLGGPLADTGVALLTYRDGRLLAVANTRSKGEGLASAWLVSLDPDGTPRWDRTVGAAKEQRVLAADAVDDGGAVLVGEVLEGGESKAWMVRVDARGAPRWERAWPKRQDGQLDAVTALPDGGFAAAGRSSQRTWLMRVSPSGERLWEREIGPERSGQSARAVVPGAGGGVVMSGTLVRPDVMAFWLIGTDAHGAPSWSRVTRSGVPLDAGLRAGPGGFVVYASTIEDEVYRLRVFRIDRAGRVKCR